MRKVTVAFLLCVILCMGMLAGCGQKPKEEGTKVVLNEVAHSVFYAPMYVAIENGYFAEEGIDLELITGFGADKTMTALLSGEADIGFMGSESTIYTYAQGADDYAVNFAQLTQRAGNFLVAREPIEDFSWDMLIGKNVLGGRAGGMPELVFEYVLKKNGIDPMTDLSIDQSIDFGATAAAFTGGQGEFSVEFEPHASSLEQNKTGYIVASLGEASGYVPYTAFSAKKSYLEKNPQVIEHFVAGLKKGMEFAENHTAEEIAEVIAPQFAETDRELLSMIVARYKNQDSWKTDLVFEKESFDLLQNILEEGGVLEQRVPYESLVTTDFVR